MSAAKGNKTALNNHNAGRKPIFKNPDILQKKIDAYFKSCPDKKPIATASGTIVELPVFTISGLAYFLGFESRQSFYDYEERHVFSYIIKRARLKIETIYEQNLHFNNATGSIFALKNMDWKDKSETDITSRGESIRQQQLTPDQIAKAIDKL